MSIWIIAKTRENINSLTRDTAVQTIADLSINGKYTTLDNDILEVLEWGN